MTQDEIIEMAREAGFDWSGKDLIFECFICTEELEAFAKLVAEKEREVVANWIMDRGFATGHGDSIVDLLDQLEWQIAEHEREACAKVADAYADGLERNYSEIIADAIRARGQA
jgi:hypothetical protein